MAPEQLRGERVGPAADIYALGVVLHELVLGTRPFEGGSAYALLKEKLAMRRPRVDAAAEIPQRLEAIVARALAPRPGGRQPTAEALAAELEGLLTPKAPAPVPGPSSSRWSRGSSSSWRSGSRSPCATDADPRVDPLFRRPHLLHDRRRFHRSGRRWRLPGRERARELCLEARAAIASGNFTVALDLADRARACAPSLGEPHYLRAWIDHDHDGDPRGGPRVALETIEVELGTAVELEPALAAAWALRAAIRFEKRDERAIEDATRRIELEPLNAEAWFRRANYRHHLQHAADALGDLVRAAELDPSRAAGAR